MFAVVGVIRCYVAIAYWKCTEGAHEGASVCSKERWQLRAESY